MSGFPEEGCPRRRAGAEGAWFGSELVLLDPAGTTLRGLNATAVAVWEACDGTATARQLAERIAGRYGVPLERVLPDVLAFLTRLVRAGLIDDARPGAGGGG